MRANPLPAVLLAAALLARGVDVGRAQTVRINEIQAANAGTVADPDFGNWADWIELHNAGPAGVDLGGHFLTDDAGIPDRWRIPDGTTVPAGGYLVVWADGRDQGLHASFSLSRDGEYVRLSDPAGLLLDAVSFDAMPEDASFGRLPGDGSSWGWFTVPTPGEANGGAPVSGFLDPPVVDPPAGFHTGPVRVSISAVDAGAVVRYTLDGTVPHEGSAAAAGPIDLATTSVVRAAAFRPGYVPSPVATSTFFVGETPTLPVVSLSTDPANFFDDEIGIYVKGTNGVAGYCRTEPHNWNQDWERPVHVELFETDGSLSLDQDAGVKIFGGCTRIYDQKSLALYARGEYGPGRFRHRVFPWLAKDSFNNLVLRSSAQDWWRTMFRDGMIQTLVQQGMSIETQAYRPALVFLNGQYWGIHNLREKLNEHHFADLAGLPPDQIDIVQNDDGSVRGGSAHFEALMAFVRTDAIAAPGGLDVVAEWLDVEGWTDYLVAEIYSANGDWPGNNLKYWRPATGEGRWRGALFDMDMGFGGNSIGLASTNTLALATSTQGEYWSNPPWSTELLRRMLLNRPFRNLFIQRMAAHMSTTFEVEHVLHVIDSLQANIAAEIPRHRERWPKSISYNQSWDFNVDLMRSFARDRAARMRGFIDEKFGVPGSARLNLAVDPPGAGAVRAAGVDMPLDGPVPVFFRNVPLALRAAPADGYRFVRWEGDRTAATDTTTVVLTGETWMTAVFEPVSVRTEPSRPGHGFDLLEPIYPNPASSTATVGFATALAVPVSIVLLDALGRRVATLAERPYPAGRHAVQVPVEALPAGVYLVVMQTPGSRSSRRMTVLH